MAWTAMLGAESVEYHRAAVVERGDDHPGQALEYYASRGETPLEWGGSGATGMVLFGEVTAAEYTAIFGVGGAKHPASGERLVSTRRPGIDLVVSAHKSVAELGVIGRAEEMHAILDAERDATMAYLDDVVRDSGGRRGRERVPTPTHGLTFAHTRHATSRAGDPCPHDHVLVANVVEMADAEGGFKALDTIRVRDHLHAATMVGRLAGARKAVELGYAICPDSGTSGRLGHWAIDGIPDEVMVRHSKRSMEIDDYVERGGHSSWRARQVAALRTRDVKRHTPVKDLVPRWRQELAEIGWPIARLNAEVEGAARRALTPEPLTSEERDKIRRELLDPDGPLARAKVFYRRDLVVAAAPFLFGRPIGECEQVVDEILDSKSFPPWVYPLVAKPHGEQAYALPSVVHAEHRIDHFVDRGMRAKDAAVLDDDVVSSAVQRTEIERGHVLTEQQRKVVEQLCTSGRRVDIVLGVAGSGKTTALGCVTDAYQAAGHVVVGTATSGQAARTLGREAQPDDSRTLASLRWQVDHGRIALDTRHVVILDEAGMTNDRDLLKLLEACDAAGARVILVGDHRQLSAVGPGGAFGALLERHRQTVQYLGENLRQHNPEEREVLKELRNGDVTRAVDWYLDHGRIHASPNRDTILGHMADAWVRDALAGHDTAMYAWQRRNVDELNHIARERWRAAGQLVGPELTALGGRTYQAGDLIVTLSPGRDTVTSERGHVLKVRPNHETLVARMDDGRVVRLAGDQIDRTHLAHGYAVTVHRAQGATVDIAHRFEDGGGRELSYVAMSRARDGTHSWVVADDRNQAREDLARDWSRETRVEWAIDLVAAGLRRAPDLDRGVERGLGLGRSL